MKILHLQILGLMTMLNACSLGGPLRKDEKATSYSVGGLPSAWVEQKVEDEGGRADRSYIHSQHGAVIALSTVCKRYDRVPLAQLRKDLVNPMQDNEVTSEEIRSLDGRDALYTRAKGKLDGVSVESSFVVLRKNECIFDFSLFARDKISAADERDFNTFVNSFHYEGNP